MVSGRRESVKLGVSIGSKESKQGKCVNRGNKMSGIKGTGTEISRKIICKILVEKILEEDKEPAFNAV